MGELGQHPRAVFDFVERSLLIGRPHPFDCAYDVAEDLTKVGPSGHPGDVAWPEVQHPLGGLLSLFIVAELDMRVGQKRIDQDIVRRLSVEIFG